MLPHIATLPKLAKSQRWLSIKMQRLDVFQSSFASKTNFRTCHAHSHTHTYTGKNADLCALGQSWSTLDRKWRPTCCQMPIQSVLPCLAPSPFPILLSLSLSLSLWWHTNAICIIDCDCHLLRLAMQHVASARLRSVRLDSTRLVAARGKLFRFVYMSGYV